MNESPLLTIRESEREAAELIEKARLWAEEEVERARHRAAGMLTEAEDQGKRIAQRRHREGLEAARADAQRTLRQGEQRAAAIADEAAPYVPEAVAALVELVLPDGKTEEA